MLSNYFNNIASKYGRKTCSDNKLVPNLGNKSYSLQKSSVVFIARNEISWCSQCFKFRQSDWLMKDNDFNTDKRENAANS